MPNSRLIKQTVNGILGPLLGIEIELRRYHRSNHRPQDKIMAMFPNVPWKKSILLEHGIFDPVRGTLYIFHDTGLFSCLSVTLWCLCDLFRKGHATLRIDFSATLSAYKDEPNTDVYPELFVQEVSAENLNELLMYPPNRFQHFDHHGNYSEIDFEIISKLIATYFNFNPSIRERARAFEARFLRKGQRYVGLCVRGTDKSTEISPTDSAFYVEVLDSMLQTGKVDRILIQTDQAQFFDLFAGYFRGICDSIDVLPRTGGKVVVHRTDAIHGRRVKFALNMMAAVLLLSEMPYIITHTGNVGAWILLLRGSCKNVLQATPGAGIVSLN